MSLKLSPLGKGLEALIGDRYEELVQKLGETQRTTLPIHKIRPRSGQPRKNFDPEKLDALSVSIREQGMLQPILVRAPTRLGGAQASVGAPSHALSGFETKTEKAAPLTGYHTGPGENTGENTSESTGKNTGEDDDPSETFYEIIAGERRWRAAQKAELAEVPVAIMAVTPELIDILALTENLQREDLNPIEEAQAYAKLVQDHRMSHDKIASLSGKSRPAIVNSLRLLTLPASVQAHVASGVLSASHARTLVGSPKSLEMSQRIMAQSLTVRETEQMVAYQKKKKKTPLDGKSLPDLDPDFVEYLEQLERKFGMKVEIQQKKNGAGRLSFFFRQVSQLTEVLQHLRTQ